MSLAVWWKSSSLILLSLFILYIHKMHWIVYWFFSVFLMYVCVFVCTHAPRIELTPCAYQADTVLLCYIPSTLSVLNTLSTSVLLKAFMVNVFFNYKPAFINYWWASAHILNLMIIPITSPGFVSVCFY